MVFPVASFWSFFQNSNVRDYYPVSGHIYLTPTTKYGTNNVVEQRLGCRLSTETCQTTPVWEEIPFEVSRNG